MRDNTSAVVIAGCGCAGLSLAVHLLASPGFNRQVVVIDPRQPDQYANDRTWCGFETRPHPFSDLVSHRWANWQVGNAGRMSRATASLHAYACLPADRFYARCFERLASDNRVVPLFGHVAHLVSGGVDVCPVGGGLVRRIAAAHVFDGRRPAEIASSPANLVPAAGIELTLWQQFAGMEVETDADVFDPGCATLMDFACSGDIEGIRFMYVLPFTGRKALVQCTAFTRKVLPDSRYLAEVERYLQKKYRLSSWRIARPERGVIPMTTHRPDHQPELHVTRIGTMGGLVKPSTGYAFAAIQEHSAALAASVVAGRVHSGRPGRWVSLALDRIFLSYLDRYPERAPALFARITASTPADRFARFMMNHGTYADDLAVMASMPKWPFIIEALRSWRLWLRGDSSAAGLVDETDAALPSSLVTQ